MFTCHSIVKRLHVQCRYNRGQTMSTHNLWPLSLPTFILCMYGREGTGEVSILYSLYACVSQQPLASVVMTVVLSHRCFDSLSKHKPMWLGWRLAITAESVSFHVLHPKPSAIPPPNLPLHIEDFVTFKR